jgi:hypothetical protein
MEKVLWIGCAVTRDARGPRSGGVRNKVSRAWSGLQHAWSLGVRSRRFMRLRYTEPLMFPRVLAFLMAMVMLWSSVAVAEQRFAEALETPASTATVTVPGDAKRRDRWTITGWTTNHLSPLPNRPRTLRRGLTCTARCPAAQPGHPVLHGRMKCRKRLHSWRDYGALHAASEPSSLHS